MLLFHGVYGRMYSLFLVHERRSRSSRSCARSSAAAPAAGRSGRSAMLLCVAAHPYGALVLAIAGRRTSLVARMRLREAAVRRSRPSSCSGSRSGAPISCSPAASTSASAAAARSSARPVDRATSRASPATSPRAYTGAGHGRACCSPSAGYGGSSRRKPQQRLLVAAVVVVAARRADPGAARLGAAESRHLIFVLPFFALVVAEGLLRRTRRLGRQASAPLVVAVGLLALLPAEVAWGWQRDAGALSRRAAARIVGARARRRPGSRRRPAGRRALRLRARSTSQAWRAGRARVEARRPAGRREARAEDARGARKPLGRGVWVFDASDADEQPSRRRRSRCVSPYGPRRSSRRQGVRAVPGHPDDEADRLRRPTISSCRAGSRSSRASPPLRLGDADIEPRHDDEGERRLATQKHPPPC